MAPRDNGKQHEAAERLREQEEELQRLREQLEQLREEQEQRKRTEEILAQARAARGGSSKPQLHPKHPMISARSALQHLWQTRSGQTLYRYRGAFWEYTGSYFRLTEDEAIRNRLWLFLEQAESSIRPAGKGEKAVDFIPKSSIVTDVCNALMAVAELQAHIQDPVWINHNGPPPKEILPCSNGLLHLPTGQLSSPTPEFFCLTATEVAFDPAAPQPQLWLAFLHQLFGDDQQAIELLQEWFGYVLSCDTSQQKILLMYGPRRSGKGTIARILRALVGEGSVADPPVSSLGRNFGLQPLIAKTLAIVSDVKIGRFTDTAALAEHMLAISGEDNRDVDRKNRTVWHGKLSVRFMILTNELPSMSDGASALVGRYLLLELANSFYGREDNKLTEKLLGELPGILNWAIAGNQRLNKRGHFVQPESGKAALDDIAMMAAPVRAFVRDCCKVGPGLNVKVDAIWERFQHWCESEGRSSVGTKTWFGRNLHSAVPGIKKTTPRAAPGSPERDPEYEGLGLKPPPPL